MGLDVEPSEEGRKVTVVFGGKDILVDTNAVGRYLMGASSNRPQTGDEAIIKAGKAPGLVSVEVEERKTRQWIGSGLEVL